MELFEFIKRENVKTIITHVVETYRDQLKDVNYVPTFQQLILRYDQLQGIQGTESTDTSFITQDGEPNSLATANPLVRHTHAGTLLNGGGTRWQGIRDTDADEEAYFDSVQNDDDEEDELSLPSVTSTSSKTISNGITLHSSGTPMKHALVSYPDDDNDEADVDLDQMDVLGASPGTPNHNQHPTTSNSNISELPSSSPESPAGSVSTLAKRRREDEEEDELSKLAGTYKRRTSSSTLGRSTRNGSPDSKLGNGESPIGNGNHARDHAVDEEAIEEDSRGAVREPNSTNSVPQHGHMLRRKGNLKSGKDGGAKKIAISFTVKEKDPGPSSEAE